MNTTKIRYRGKVVKNDPMTNPDSGYVEGFYFQDLDDGEIKHYIFNCPMTWEVKPETVKIIRYNDIPDFDCPVTTQNDIKELQEKLVQTCIDFIKERNLTDVNGISFNVDGLFENAIKYGEWTPEMDSYIGVEGLQDEAIEVKEGSGKFYKMRVRALIGESM